jgi:predicted alpha/beta-fold hydrolase
LSCGNPKSGTTQKFKGWETLMSDPMSHTITETDHIAYRRFSGDGPGIIFLAGHGSDMEGSKALFLEDWAQTQGQAFLRFDYRGHGQSSGSMDTTNISDWTEDVITVIDELSEGSPDPRWIFAWWMADAECGPCAARADCGPHWHCRCARFHRGFDLG